jgi:TRAP-type C4-dicarboxylate transport system substrate-binding protein
MIATGVPTANAQTWTLPSWYPQGDPYSKILGLFAAEVEKQSGGKLKINVLPGGALLPPPAIKQAVQRGEVPIGEMVLSAYENQDPLFGLDTVPFLVTTYRGARLLWAASRVEIEKRLDESGLVLLYAAPGPLYGMVSRKKIDSPDQFKGLRLRAFDAATEAFAKYLGAEPVRGAPNIAEALFSNQADAGFAPPNTAIAFKLSSVAKYYHDVHVMIPKRYVIVNKQAFLGLPDGERGALRAAARTAEEQSWEIAPSIYADDFKNLPSQAFELVPSNGKLESAFFRASAETIKTWLDKTGAPGRVVIERYASLSGSVINCSPPEKVCNDRCCQQN